MTRLCMPDLSDTAPAREYVEAAFEACCGALLSVEVAVKLVDAEDDERAERRAHLQQAIAQLRGTLTELRRAEEDESSLLATGVVLPAPRGWRGTAAA